MPRTGRPKIEKGYPFRGPSAWSPGMPAAGRDYPGRYADFLAWFGADEACLDYLDWQRWPDGCFVCPSCQGSTRWKIRDRWRCASCRRRVSATAGTLFARTRTPLTVRFEAAWRMTTSKNGVSALELQRTLGLGSYQTAWTMLHRFRMYRFRIAMGAGDKDSAVVSKSMKPLSAVREAECAGVVPPGKPLW